VAMAAGLANLRIVQEDGFHERLGAATERLTAGLIERARAAGIALASNHVGGMFGLFFSEQDPVSNFSQVMACDQKRFVRFFHGMLGEGVYLAPSAFEAGFVSSAHDEAAIGATLEAAERVFATLAQAPGT
jgi:glutamate-1-semialdehyde 2,1-aminomutase